MVISSGCSEHRTSTERCFTEMKTGFLILTGSNRIVRKIKDYFEHVAGKEQDIAVEIII